MVDGCEEWVATELWKDLDYLEENFGSQSIEIIRLDRGSQASL
jgi:hypothetical protein